MPVFRFLPPYNTVTDMWNKKSTFKTRLDCYDYFKIAAPDIRLFQDSNIHQDSILVGYNFRFLNVFVFFISTDRQKSLRA